MRLDSLTRYTKGWIFGDITPCLFNNKDVEVAIKKYKKNDKECRHTHRIATEFTIIITGKVKMNGVEFFQDDIIVIEPNESTDFEALTDTTTLCVKTPSVIGDKYMVGD